MGMDVALVKKIISANYDISKLSPDLEDQRDELVGNK
jgi:hypothetical protein